jgi:hypothetical protein
MENLELINLAKALEAVASQQQQDRTLLKALMRFVMDIELDDSAKNREAKQRLLTELSDAV